MQFDPGEEYDEKGTVFKMQRDNCPACHGEGWVKAEHWSRTCPCCKHDASRHPCRKCNGKGYV